MLSALTLVALIVPAILLSAACRNGDEDADLSPAEVKEIVQTEIAEIPPPPTLEPGLTLADVEQAILNALVAMPEPGLSKGEVDRIVESAIAAIPEPQPGLTSEDVEEAIINALEDMPQAEPGLPRSEVDLIVEAAIAGIPEPQPGLTSEDLEEAIRGALAEAQRIARGVVASIPPKSASAEYTKFFVNNAISRYETQGLEATLAYYNREESVDGQWYVFIVDENDLVIGHPDPHRIGLDLKGWVSLDATGYNFGPDMLSATEEGRWVSYVYQNPESGGIGDDHTGALEYKHVWVVRHDELLFASGWHISADEFTKFIVNEAISRFHTDGLQATLAYYNNPDSVNAQWYVFITTPEGEILAHHNAEDFGVHLQEMLDDGSFMATEQGVWVNHEDVNPATGEVEDKHFWLIEHDGLVFGSGWHHDASGS